MGKVIMSGIVPQLEAPVAFNPVFANNTWEQIIEACQKNKIPKTWNVGDSKMMTINGVDCQIDIIGKNHDTYATGGTAPLTFQTHDTRGMSKMSTSSSNAKGWDGCTVRTTSLPEQLTWMPSEVQSAIKEVNKITSAGNKSSTLETTADKLFLLSVMEVFGTSQYSVAGEGDQYEYYAAGNSTIKNFYSTGKADAWWLRSPYKNNSSNYCLVMSDGTANYRIATSDFRYSFAFCF